MKNNAERSGDASAQLMEFADRLGSQLDRIGFPANPKRAAAFSERLGIPKTQAYKLLRGMAFPNLAGFIALKRMGISIDDILNSMGHIHLDLTKLVIGEQSVEAAVTLSAEDRGRVFVLERPDGRSNLLVLADGEKAPGNAQPVASLSFPQRRRLAIIEDNPQELAMLTAGMQGTFAAQALATAAQLFQQEVSDFDVFLLDWNLPDMPGREVVRQLRERTSAPIFILTGDMGASTDILDAMSSDPTVRLITKPTNVELINITLVNALTFARS